MGQAKKRGSFEQRKADAIQREAEERKRYDQEFARRREAERAYEAANPRKCSRGVSSIMLAAAIMGGLSAATKE